MCVVMEGGDNPEQLTKTEDNKQESPVPDENVGAPSTELTDSLLDDDLVVIPSQNEQIEEEIHESGLADSAIVPPVQSSSVEPEPQASVTASEAPEQSSRDVPPTVIPPPQPNPILAPEPSRPVMAAKPIKAAEDDEDFEDETLLERLIGLTEMFPEGVRSAADTAFGLSLSGLKTLFNFSRSALWIGSTSFMVLILPVVFETEMVHMEQAQIQRQKQILLGPNAATAGAMTGAMTPPMPGVSVAAPPPESR